MWIGEFVVTDWTHQLLSPREWVGLFWILRGRENYRFERAMLFHSWAPGTYPLVSSCGPGNGFEKDWLCCHNWIWHLDNAACFGWHYHTRDWFYVCKYTNDRLTKMERLMSFRVARLLCVSLSGRITTYLFRDLDAWKENETFIFMDCVEFDGSCWCKISSGP